MLSLALYPSLAAEYTGYVGHNVRGGTLIFHTTPLKITIYIFSFYGNQILFQHRILKFLSSESI